MPRVRDPRRRNHVLHVEPTRPVDQVSPQRVAGTADVQVGIGDAGIREPRKATGKTATGVGVNRARGGIRKLARRATLGHIRPIRHAAPVAARRVGEKAGAGINGGDSERIDHLVVQHLVLLDVARPVVVDARTEHRHVQVIERLGAVEGVDSYRRRGEGGVGLDDLRQNVIERARELGEIGRRESLAAAGLRCVVEVGEGCRGRTATGKVGAKPDEIAGDILHLGDVRPHVVVVQVAGKRRHALAAVGSRKSRRVALDAQRLDRRIRRARLVGQTVREIHDEVLATGIVRRAVVVGAGDRAAVPGTSDAGRRETDAAVASAADGVPRSAGGRSRTVAEQDLLPRKIQVRLIIGFRQRGDAGRRPAVDQVHPIGAIGARIDRRDRRQHHAAAPAVVVAHQADVDPGHAVE